MHRLAKIRKLVSRGIGGLLVVTLLIAALWAVLWVHDISMDRKHIVTARSETPIFAGPGDACRGTQIATIHSGVTFRVQRIRYWKNCATMDIALPDGRRGYIIFDSRDVSVSPPLA